MTRKSKPTTCQEGALTKKGLAGQASRQNAKPSVLFLCDGKEGYSLVAQSILTHKANSYFRGFSAFTSSTCDVTSACHALHQYNIVCSDKYHLKIDNYKEERVDYLIAMSPSSVQSGKPLPEYSKFIPWDVTGGGEVSNKHSVVKYINEQINYFLSVYLYR
ncbi:hypothetical protein L4D06_02255 [Enterovibrio makurazakiensis]|uniref:hypothetical protein n=1 Tax=Enterovibrio makurazakiensis TaxID=2910232 RepID=UPI003D1A6857